MKKFVNDPAKFVPEMLEGIALANEGTLKYEPKYNLIYRADRPSNNHVSVIQGSGSGHEPAHVMTVGRGMLDAASPGNVFAAPPMEYCLECIKLMNSPKGVLVLSGILAMENEKVRAAFAAVAPGWAMDSRTMGEWSDVVLRRG